MNHQPAKVILGVTGGIAAYKAADLCSKLRKTGAEVRVAFSPSAHKFVTPLVFEALSGNPVYQQLFDAPESFEMEHISWARWADAYIIAPTTADTLARLAAGHANDPITTLYLAFRGPTFVAPSMNTAMLEHPATQANLATLSQRGVNIITPGSGTLACGEIGPGRMAEPTEIMAALGFPIEPSQSSASAQSTHPSSAAQPSQPVGPPDDTLAGKTVLITSGPTREYLDPVRFISSPSSGKMGLALANEAMRRGANVHFVTGPVNDTLLPQGDCQIHQVETARDMLSAVDSLKDECQLFIFAAAVGDFRPANPIHSKIKRSGNSITLPLIENPDIAQALGFAKRPDQIMIGFAAETDDHIENAKSKLATKHLDAIITNDVSNPEIGFGSQDNEITIVTTTQEPRHIPRASKPQIAKEILETATKLLPQ